MHVTCLFAFSSRYAKTRTSNFHKCTTFLGHSVDSYLHTHTTLFTKELVKKYTIHDNITNSKVQLLRITQHMYSTHIYNNLTLSIITQAVFC